MLRPVGILQMAIKMHEVCWNRGEEPGHLSGKNKTSERGEEGGGGGGGGGGGEGNKTQVESVAKAILQGPSRALQTSAAPPRLLVRTSDN